MHFRRLKRIALLLFIALFSYGRPDIDEKVQGENSNGYKFSGTINIGHEKLPLLLSAQMNQPVVTSISPNPGFSWNVGLSYNF